MGTPSAISQSSPTSLAPALSAARIRTSYRPDVDGLRAVAALAVVGSHAGLVRGGFVGVDIFFVISGYLISGIILRSLVARSFSFLDFYARRVRRIFPALVLVLAVVLLFGRVVLLSDEYRLLGKDVAAGAVFLMNFTQWLHPDPTVNLPRILPHLWSLSVEEQFYLVWPLVLWAIWRWARRHFIYVLLLVTLASFCADVMLSWQRPMTAYALPWARVWQLSLGCALAYSEVTAAHPSAVPGADPGGHPFSRLRMISSDTRALLGGMLLVASFICITTTHIETLPVLWKLAPTVGTVLLISAGSQASINRHVLSAAPVVFIGLISYPLYLWHLPLLQALRIFQHDVTPAMTATAVAVAIIVSIGTYKYIELPLRPAGRGALKTGLLLALMAACGLTGYLALLGFVPTRPHPQTVDKIIAATTEDLWSASRRDLWQLSSDGFWFRGSSPRYALYVGDSNMAQYHPRIDRLLTEHPSNSRSALVAARDGCAPLAVQPFDLEHSDRATCREFLRSVAQWAASPQVEVVVIGASWYRYFRRFAGDRGSLRRQAEPALRDLQRTLEALVKAGKRVYLVLNIPVHARFDPHRMIRRTFASPGFVLDVEMPRRAEVADAIDPFVASLVRIAEFAGATVIDPVPSFCDSERCRAIAEDGAPVYRDMWHLRPSYVRDYVDFLDLTLLDVPGERVQR